MKITKNQLKKIIIEMITVGPDGTAIYLDPHGDSPLETEKRLRDEYVKDHYPDKRITDLAKSGPEFHVTARTIADELDDYQAGQLSPEQEIAQAMYDKDAVSLPITWQGKDYSDEYSVVRRQVTKLMEDELNSIDPNKDLDHIQILDRLYDAGHRSRLLKKMIDHFDNLSPEESMTDGANIVFGFESLPVDVVYDINKKYKIVDHDEYINWRAMTNYR